MRNEFSKTSSEHIELQQKNVIGTTNGSPGFKGKTVRTLLHFFAEDQYYFQMPQFTKTESELETRQDKWLYFLKNLESFDRIQSVSRWAGMVLHGPRKRVRPEPDGFGIFPKRMKHLLRPGSQVAAFDQFSKKLLRVTVLGDLITIGKQGVEFLVKQDANIRGRDSGTHNPLMLTFCENYLT